MSEYEEPTDVHAKDLDFGELDEDVDSIPGDNNALENDYKALVPGNKEIRQMVLRCFARGGKLSRDDVVRIIRESGDISDEGLKVKGKSEPLYVTRIQTAIWKLFSIGHYLDSPTPGVYTLNESGIEECLRLGLITSHYTKDDFLRDVYMSSDRFERLLGVLLSRKNVILQGAPGVGKTFCARRLAWSVMNERDDSRIEMIQFHQSYGYEDFMMGYKPQGEGFELKEGVFYQFCKKAENDYAGRPYFFIIDEINRGNLSKIFGEVMMLVERDHRGDRLRLAYRDEEFSVPKNLYLIGMMNTADRSIALIDYALRRRFSFFDMPPAFGTDGFKTYQKSLSSATLDRLVNKIIQLNSEIAGDPTLGKGFRIGHSHLCGRKQATDQWLRSVVDFDIIPTLEEYWFDNDEKVKRWEDELHGVFE